MTNSPLQAGECRFKTLSFSNKEVKAVLSSGLVKMSTSIFKEET